MDLILVVPYPSLQWDRLVDEGWITLHIVKIADDRFATMCYFGKENENGRTNISEP
jgi:hypothetical protein